MAVSSLTHRVATSYCNFLRSLDWSDELLVAGLREGLNKFLSNAFIHLVNAETGRKKYQQADWISVTAKQRMESREKSGFVYEHMIPKRIYIQKPCEVAAKSGALNVEFVEDLLDRYWHIAVVTQDEDKALADKGLRNRMPKCWDGVDIFARYHAVGITLIRYASNITIEADT